MSKLPVIWKEVVGYESLYEVSNTGLVRGMPKTVSGNHLKEFRKIPSREKKQCYLHGYPAVTLFKGGKPKLIKVHRLVCEAFLPNPSNLPMVNHKDSVKTNNQVSNLEWCTAKQNIEHMILAGRNYQVPKGQDCSWTNLVNENVGQIRSLYFHGMKQKEIGHLFEISQQQVSRICNKTRWGHI